MCEPVLDICIQLTAPPLDAPPDAIADITLHDETAGLSYKVGFLADPLTESERLDLQWYLEEYWLWPYEGFAQRAKDIEAVLPIVGQRLYNAVFSRTETSELLRVSSATRDDQHQIRIVSDIPSALSLPWELLHDGRQFLCVSTSHPVAIVRRLPLSKQSHHQKVFIPPLRILLITAQPEGTGFVDPRSIAHELYDALQAHYDAGTIELEFLRPPTLAALQKRLKAHRHLVHVLHFDGHGIFDRETMQQGVLAFEDEDGHLDAVEARALAQVLQDSGVRFVVLTACQSAVISREDSLSSVAAQLVQCGVDAVVAMNASVLVASTTRYTQALYHALATGMSVSMAHEQALLALHRNPNRHLQRRHHDERGMPVRLYDWWVPQLYLQQAISLLPDRPVLRRKKPKGQPLSLRWNEDMPGEPRYGFSGRARELLRLERWLLQGKMVIISGFGGTGKTILAREAANWFTRTRMYDGACFISFEHGGDAAMLLSMLGHYLGIYEGQYHPDESTSALLQLGKVLKKKRILLIADNLESILPGGEAPLEAELCTQLWDVLLELTRLGAGVLLTSRDPGFDDERLSPGSQSVRHLLLRGLRPTDAFMLATHLFTDLNIDPAHVPYPELRDLLALLDHHPLAIQLVLPVLRELPVTIIRSDFATLLPRFVDNAETGHNRSLLASLEYSLRRFSENQRILLSRLACFEGGANEETLLQITEIPGDEWFTTLRTELEHAGLLVVEYIPGYTELHSRIFHPVLNPYLHFHPVLTPFLRNQVKEDDHVLDERYANRYGSLVEYLHLEDTRNPGFVRKLIQRELPNFYHALRFWIKEGDQETALVLAERIATFLEILGFYGQRDELTQRMMVAMAVTEKEERLTFAEYTYRSKQGNEALKEGDVLVGRTHFERLLRRFEEQPEDVMLGRNSYEHCITLKKLAYCLRESGQLESAQRRLREAITIITSLREYVLRSEYFIHVHCVLLGDLGDAFRAQGEYAQAEMAYKEALDIARRVKNVRDIVVCLGQMGTLARVQRNFTVARQFYTKELKFIRQLNEPAIEGDLWYQMGTVAFDQGDLTEAERCYRESVAITDRLKDDTATATTYNGLSMIAQRMERLPEAEQWLKRALSIAECKHPQSDLHSIILNNLAFVLVQGLRSGQFSHITAVHDARQYAQQAIAIAEKFGINAETWRPFSILADLAELEGRLEEARKYRHRVNEAFAAFKGNRTTIDHIYLPLIHAIVAAVKGDIDVQSIVDVILPFETEEFRVTDAVQRLYKGERDWHSLTEDMEPQSTLIILRVLEILASTTVYKHDN